MQPLFTQKEMDSHSSDEEGEPAKKDDEENPF